MQEEHIFKVKSSAFTSILYLIPNIVYSALTKIHHVRLELRFWWGCDHLSTIADSVGFYYPHRIDERCNVSSAC